MKGVLALSVLSLTCFLAACGTGVQEEAEQDASNIEETGNELHGEVDHNSAAPGEWQETSNGTYRLTSYGYNRSIGLDFSENPYVPLEAGPMAVTIQQVTVMDFKPENGQKRVVFGGKDEVRIVSAYMVVDNYSGRDILFNPDEALLVTNTGETLKPLKYWTDTIDGTFAAGATKAAGVSWATDDVDSDLTSVLIVIDPPVPKDENLPLSEPLEVEIEILPY